MTYELLSQSKQLNKWGGRNKSGGLENFLKKKIIGETLIWDPRVYSINLSSSIVCLSLLREIFGNVCIAIVC